MSKEEKEEHMNKEKQSPGLHRDRHGASRVSLKQANLESELGSVAGGKTVSERRMSASRMSTVSANTANSVQEVI